jgi:GlpG protein
MGVTTQLRKEPDGWGVWVLDEDRIPVARQELEAFRKNPDDPRFQSAARSAETIRRESQRKDVRFRKNYRFVSDTWDAPNLRRRPLTFVLIVASVIIYLLMSLPGTREKVEDALLFSVDRIELVHGQPVLQHGSIDDIVHGQVWRLITPIFLHFNFMHLLFNLMALAYFGTMIEYRRGTLTLALLVILSAIASNLGEYLYEVNTLGHPAAFGGFSGVVYALFGYVWMKSLYEPEQGMILHPSSVQTMLLWLVLCMMGLIGNVANAAHVVGLLVGIVCGLAGL